MYYGEQGLGVSASDFGKVIGSVVGLPRTISGQFKDGYEATSGQRLPSKLPPIVGQASSFFDSLFGKKPSPILPTVTEGGYNAPQASSIGGTLVAAAPYVGLGLIAWKLLKLKRR